MSLTNPKNVVTEERLSEFYNRILPYLGGSAEAGFTPVGTVISVMGKTAPANYLPCDGRVVNISDYPELADYFKEQFGSSNYFGGDGTTTFGIVDLSGEFLRGAGTNSHTNQGSGGEVGEHQDATEIPDVKGVNNTIVGSKGATKKYDKAWTDGTTNTITASGSSSGSGYSFATRPTNTSVLFCIATKNIFLNPSLDFSTSEKVVGTWISGKPLYQKSFQTDITVPSSGTIKNAVVGQIASDFENVIGYIGEIHQGATNFVPVDRPSPVHSIWISELVASKGTIYFNSTSATDLAGTSTIFLTVRYTKTTD